MMDNGENTGGEISETGTDSTQETNEGLSASLFDAAETSEGSSTETSSHEIGLSHSLYQAEGDSKSSDTAETAAQGNCPLTQNSLSVEITGPMDSGIRIEGTHSYTENSEQCEQDSDAQGDLTLGVSGRWSLTTEFEEEKKHQAGCCCDHSTAT